MTTLTITTNVSTPDTEDRRAMLYMIERENVRRSLLTPPLAALPSSTAAERKTSYETVLNTIIASAHASYIAMAVQSVELDPLFKDLRLLWVEASNAQKTAAKAALGG